MLLGDDKCNRDEYPPFRFLGGSNGIPGAPAPANYDQWIRFLPQYDNQRAGQLWNGLCSRVGDKQKQTEDGPINGQVCTEIVSVTYRVKAMSMDFIRLPVRLDNAMTDNWCQIVSSVRVDPGFNLLNEDARFNRDGRQYQSYTPDYTSVPNALITAGLTRPRRIFAECWTSHHVDLDEIIVDNGNSTRFATPEELREKGLYKCQSEDCEEEKEQLGFLVAPESAMSGNAIVEAAPTSEPAQSLNGYTPSRSRKTGSAPIARNTAEPLAPVVDDHTGASQKKRHRHGYAHHRHI